MKKLIPLLFAAHILTANECYDLSCFDYAINAPVSAPSDCGKFFWNADYLLLKPQLSHLITGISYVQGPFIDNDPSLIEIKEKRFTPSFESGFRVGFGYGLPYDQFAGEVLWTWLQSDLTSSDSSPGFYPQGQSRFGTYFEPGLDNFSAIADLERAQESKSRWKMRFNQVDMLLFREYVVGCSLALKPSFGVQLLFVEQRYNAKSFEPKGSSIPLFEGRWKSHCQGIGISCGLESFFDLGCCLGLFGQMRLGLLLSHAKTSHNVSLPEVDDLHLENLVVNDAIGGVLANFEAAAGIEWRCPINCAMHFLFLRLAFEEHLILDQNLFSKLELDERYLPRVSYTRGDLSLFGLSLRLGVKF